jgi:hypothetical protein
MRKFLSHDSQTGELRLVYTDLWEGQHERTEYRVTGWRTGGEVLRNMPEYDGAPVYGNAPGLYVKPPVGSGQIPVWTEEISVGPMVKTPCPKAVSSRRKCALCAAE